MINESTNEKDKYHIYYNYASYLIWIEEYENVREYLKLAYSIAKKLDNFCFISEIQVEMFWFTIMTKKNDLEIFTGLNESIDYCIENRSESCCNSFFEKIENQSIFPFSIDDSLKTEVIMSLRKDIDEKIKFPICEIYSEREDSIKLLKCILSKVVSSSFEGNIQKVNFYYSKFNTFFQNYQFSYEVIREIDFSYHPIREVWHNDTFIGTEIANNLVMDFWEGVLASQIFGDKETAKANVQLMYFLATDVWDSRSSKHLYELFYSNDYFTELSDEQKVKIIDEFLHLFYQKEPNIIRVLSLYDWCDKLSLTWRVSNAPK